MSGWDDRGVRRRRRRRIEEERGREREREGGSSDGLFTSVG